MNLLTSCELPFVIVRNLLPNGIFDDIVAEINVTLVIQHAIGQNAFQKENHLFEKWTKPIVIVTKFTDALE